jgi:hypothetical protein
VKSPPFLLRHLVFGIRTAVALNTLERDTRDDGFVVAGDERSPIERRYLGCIEIVQREEVGRRRRAEEGCKLNRWWRRW